MTDANESGFPLQWERKTWRGTVTAVTRESRPGIVEITTDLLGDMLDALGWTPVPPRMVDETTYDDTETRETVVDDPDDPGVDLADILGPSPSWRVVGDRGGHHPPSPLGGGDPRGIAPISP